jgi:RHS repeat-associated protein
MQLLSDGTYDYTYDAEGRVTQRRERATGSITRYQWDGAGQLTSVTAPGGAVSSYRYDGLGRRVEVNDDGVVRRFVYSDRNLHNEFDGANALRATYVTGVFPDSVYEIVRDGTSYYPLFDALGSVTALTDDAGAVVGRVRYSAYGVPHWSGVADHGFTFTGHQYDDATGLIYARARYYDPSIGRFLSEDPKASVNPYPYVSNNPCNEIDLSGAAKSQKCGKFEWPWPWETFDDLKLIVESWDNLKEFQRQFKEYKGRDPRGNEYLIVVSAVGLNEGISKAVQWSIAQVANLYYVASCALQGNPNARAG